MEQTLGRGLNFGLLKRLKLKSDFGVLKFEASESIKAVARVLRSGSNRNPLANQSKSVTHAIAANLLACNQGFASPSAPYPD